MHGHACKLSDSGVHNVAYTSLPAGKNRGGDNARSGTGERLWAFYEHEDGWGWSAEWENEHVLERVTSADFMISDHTT